MSVKIGQLYIVSAPSGAGKSSLLNALKQQLTGIAISISHTTRQPRVGEQNGQYYHFVSVAAFQALAEQGDFLEHAQVFDNFYGTSRSALQQQLNQGLDVILEIDWQGAQQVRRYFPDAISIFILPPSIAELAERLRQRKQDSEEIIARRMKDAQREMSHYTEYDYIIINDVFEQALAELKSIFQAARLRCTVQIQTNDALFLGLVG